MIPHWTFFGWLTLITETFIVVTLILGLFTRLGSLKTAKALGLTLPPSLLQRADEVIQ